MKRPTHPGLKANPHCWSLTSGSDAPGMNAAIRAVVRSGLHQGYQMWVYVVVSMFGATL